MTHLPALTARRRATIRIASVFVLVSTAVAADPDSLPRPRAKPEPQKLVVPDDAPAAKPQPATKSAPESQAEVPRPEGRPGRAPDPPGSGKDDGIAGSDALPAVKTLGVFTVGPSGRRPWMASSA